MSKKIIFTLQLKSVMIGLPLRACLPLQAGGNTMWSCAQKNDSNYLYYSLHNKNNNISHSPVLSQSMNVLSQNINRHSCCVDNPTGFTLVPACCLSAPKFTGSIQTHLMNIYSCSKNVPANIIPVRTSYRTVPIQAERVNSHRVNIHSGYADKPSYSFPEPTSYISAQTFLTKIQLSPGIVLAGPSNILLVRSQAILALIFSTYTTSDPALVPTNHPNIPINYFANLKTLII